MLHAWWRIVASQATGISTSTDTPSRELVLFKTPWGIIILRSVGSVCDDVRSKIK